MKTDQFNIWWLNAWNSPSSQLDSHAEAYHRLKSAVPCVVKSNIQFGDRTFDMVVFSISGDALAVIETRPRRNLNTMLGGVPVFVLSDPETLDQNCQSAEDFIKDVVQTPENGEISFTHVEASCASHVASCDVTHVAPARDPSHMMPYVCTPTSNFVRGSYTPKAIISSPESTALPLRLDGPENKEVLVNKKPETAAPKSALIDHKLSSHTDPAGASQSLGGAEFELVSPPSPAEIVAVWNGTMVLPKIQTTAGRGIPMAKAARRQFFCKNYREAIKKVAASKFCKGQKRGSTWKANIDWFLREGVVERIMEGLYDDKANPHLTEEDKKYDQDTIS